MRDREPAEDASDDDASTGACARRIARAAPGEARADEEALYRRFGARIRHFGLRHLGDAAAADDLVHEVILQTFASLRAGQVREPDRIGSFILGSCRMAVRNQRRGAARRQALLARWTAEPEAGAAPGPDLERLSRCLHLLGERERTILVLTFYAERSSADISRELALTEGNVRVIRHRALAGLAGCLGRGEVAA